MKSGQGTLVYPGMAFKGGFTDDQVSSLHDPVSTWSCLIHALRQPLGPGLFKFDAGYQQAGEYIVSTDQGEGMVEDEDPKQITKWIGQTLAMTS